MAENFQPTVNGFVQAAAPIAGMAVVLTSNVPNKLKVLIK